MQALKRHRHHILCALFVPRYINAIFKGQWPRHEPLVLIVHASKTNKRVMVSVNGDWLRTRLQSAGAPVREQGFLAWWTIWSVAGYIRGRTTTPNDLFHQHPPVTGLPQLSPCWHRPPAVSMGAWLKRAVILLKVSRHSGVQHKLNIWTKQRSKQINNNRNVSKKKPPIIACHA